MKLIDVISRLDKSKRNEDDVDIEAFARLLDLNLYWIETDRFKSYWFSVWLCTDTWVGEKIYFLDDKPVAYSSQGARKSDLEIKWFTKRDAYLVRDFLKTFIEDNIIIELADINAEVGNGFNIEFNANILGDKALYLGKPIIIIKRIKVEGDYGTDTNLLIQDYNGNQNVVDISELLFEFRIT